MTDPTDDPAESPTDPTDVPDATGSSRVRSNPRGRDESRERLRSALWKPSRAQLVVGVLLAGLGFAVVTQVRANQVDDSFAGLREQDLIDVLNGLAGTTQRSQAEITRLETTRDQLQSTSSKRRTALREAQTEADNLGVLAGVVPVTGPGIRVTIKEIDGQVSLDSVLDLVQELRTVGAEAIQLNGTVRLAAQSAFENGDDGLVVDGVQLRAPYVLDAIGDPDTLAGALPFPDGPRDQLEDDGATVSTEKLPTLDILSVRQDVVPDFARSGDSQ